MASTLGARVTWSRLPADIWLKILELFLKDGASCASLAAVSPKWQAVVERHNFARIKLTPSRLGDFNSMTCRNQHLVKYLWLCLELEDWVFSYDDVTNEDNRLIATSVQTLFSTLATWKPDGNLTLDISVYSPSDKKSGLKFQPDLLSSEIHSNIGIGGIMMLSPPTVSGITALFRGLLKEQGGHGRRAKEEFLEILRKRMYRRRGASSLGDPSEGSWEDIRAHVTRTEMNDPQNELERGPSIWQKLPSVAVVTGVLLRQQTYRRWPSKQLTELFSCLPRLREIHYEPWREWCQEDQDTQDLCYKDLIDSFPPTLKKLVLFENFNSMYAAVMPNCPPRAPSLAISQALAKMSLDLDTLSGSFLIDAGFFFNTCEDSWMWPNLTSIALTSQVLSPDANAREINDLLEIAANGAQRMPKLEKLEIWNGQQGLAALFRYELKDATLTWKATWDLDIPTSIVRAWEEVARGRQCEVTKELLDGSMIKSHGDAISILKHMCLVLRPISLQQIRTEQKHFGA